ncbi:MAG: TrkH family potassium uptake protein [Lachnospiraceae bacterium]
MKRQQHEQKVLRQLTQTQIIALGFLIIILIGTMLLMLPIASRDGQSCDFLTALFTATSASCVTGLVVRDTATGWSTFGQLIILSMIQIGGLGFVTIGVLFSMLLKRKVNLRMRELLQESINVGHTGGLLRLVKKIIYGTILFEGSGAILLSIRFIPEYGPAKGIYYSIFHSISAFCNAGFDLMGSKYGEYSSFCGYYGDWLVNLVLVMLILIGGLGFLVWDDLSVCKFHFKSYSLHTKLVLISNLILIVIGTVLFLIFERDNLMADMNVSECLASALFSAVTPRTAGFNTIDTGSLTPASLLLTIVLMFIGGSPGSTAGGVKTVTITVMFLYVFSNLKNATGCNVFGRRINGEAIQKASNVLMLNLMLAICAGIAISGIQSIAFSDVIFEVFSAIGTVGMSTGVTRALTAPSRVIIIILMYCGRIGSMSFATFFMTRKIVPKVTLPTEKVMIG